MTAERPPATGVRRLWGISFLTALSAILVGLGAYWAGRRMVGLPVEASYGWQLAADWALWALFAPGIVWLAIRFPVRRDRRVSGVARHLAFGTLIALGQLLLFTAISRYVVVGVENALASTFRASYGFALSVWFPYALLIYATISIATHVVVARRREGDREVEAALLREQLGLAQLQALRMQLHPHFLFNTLNTISVLLQEGREEDANRMVIALGELLGRSLDTIDHHEIPLREELDFIERYLRLEEYRYSDRLRVRVRTSQDAQDAYVPSMILQPLVENAVRHGIERSPDAGRIEVVAVREDDNLRLEVVDDGPGVELRTTAGRGVGLENTVRRLREMYGPDASFTLGSGEPGGTRAVILLPFQTAPRLRNGAEAPA